MDQEYLKKIIHYEPETGVFIWKVSMGPRAMAGSRAGTTNSEGYNIITIEGARYQAHRLAWLYMTGSFPKELDHRNRDRSDNRWPNLRKATRSQNMQNTGVQRNNTSGARGVKREYGKWAARIYVNGEEKRLGVYNTVEEAKQAYNKAAREIFGSYYNEDLIEP